jgi:hypothetical protein
MAQHNQRQTQEKATTKTAAAHRIQKIVCFGDTAALSLKSNDLICTQIGDGKKILGSGSGLSP